MFRLIKRLLSKEEVIIPQIKTVNISSKYLKNRLPDISEFNFKVRRQRLGLSQSEVSKTIDINRPTIHNLENSVYVTCIYSNLLKLHNFYLQKESEIK